MGELRDTERAGLVIGVLTPSADVLTPCCEWLNEFGDPAETGPVLTFEFTKYYAPVMGQTLFRRFYLYAPPFDLATLPDVKRRTNAIEAEAARTLRLGVERPLNLDPGYLTLSKLVLASTKDHAHRIYLRDGIYAEVTLTFRAGAYHPWPWTFPDYASEGYRNFFRGVRERLLGK